MTEPVLHSERQTPYLFFRKHTFYTIPMKDDADAIANAECNPGTIRVEDMDCRTVWLSPE